MSQIAHVWRRPVCEGAGCNGGGSRQARNPRTVTTSSTPPSISDSFVVTCAWMRSVSFGSGACGSLKSSILAVNSTKSAQFPTNCPTHSPSTRGRKVWGHAASELRDAIETRDSSIFVKAGSALPLFPSASGGWVTVLQRSRSWLSLAHGFEGF